MLSESRIGLVSFLIFLTLENVASFTRTCFYQKRSSVTMRNYVEMFHPNIGHNLAWNFWHDNCLIENRNCYNSKTWCPQPHVVIFFLISSTFSINCTIANLMVWMSQKSCNINIWRNVNTARKIRKGLLPKNNISHSCRNSF